MPEYAFNTSYFAPLGTVTTERSSCLKHAAFSSTNFENILIWETEADIPPGTAFDVQYKQYGEKVWLNKRECQSITQPSCNLTRETENFTEHYYARVRATALILTIDTPVLCLLAIIGAPEVEYIPNVRSIKFLIQPPYTPLRGEDDRQLTIEDIYSKFGSVDYHLTIFNQRTHQKVKHNLRSLATDSFKSQFDFRGISSFQPLTLTVEHIIKPINLSRPALLIPEAQLPQISQSLDKTLDPQRSFCPPETVYQQQASVPAFQPPAQPRCLESTSPPGYAPQIAEQSVPCAVSSETLPPNYGVCGEGTDLVDKRKLQPNQTLKEVSPDCFVGGKLVIQMLGKSCSHWNYKEQRPELSLWKSSDTRESVLLQEIPGQTQQLLLQPDGVKSEVHIPQPPLSLLEQGSCYRQQRAEPLPLLSSVKVDRDSVPEDESLSSLSAAFLLSVCTGNNLPGEHNTEWWMSLDSFAHSENKLQFPETQKIEMLTAAKELNCTKLNNAVSQDTISDQDSGIPLTMLFKDINLKVQWDQGMDENTEIY
uniref:Fibronectin type-III domain-containing protein n=1 Tax=Apteryx owenii TaxID=8824 RepID=A0A8B9PS65_APTOW